MSILACFLTILTADVADVTEQWQEYHVYLENRAHFNELPFPQDTFTETIELAAVHDLEGLEIELSWFVNMHASRNLDGVRESVTRILIRLRRI